MKFRDEFPGFKYSDDIIYQRALGLLNSINEKRFKKSQVCSESVDEYIRKMRITKLITLRGNGRFIDLNSFENEKIDFVIKNYTNYEKFSNKKEYFEYISKIDENILALQVSASLEYQDDIKLKTLNNFAASYTKEQIFYELNILSSKKSSKDEVFKFIPEPTRFEFLASIALRQNLKNVEILPNYSIDDEGLPTNHASGNKPDIICYDKETCAITEVSLICGRAQINNELLPITRHLKEQKESEEQKENFAIFVAPRIFDDSKRYIKFIKFDENLDIINCDIKEFMLFIENNWKPRAIKERRKFTVLIQPNIGYGYFDENRLKQVLNNIIDNAFKFTDKNGVIIIKASRVNNTFQLDIEDNGIGISKEDLPRIKDKFYKGKNSKSKNGIGLSIADEIIMLHGGKFKINSKENEGTTIQIEIPLSEGDNL